MVPIVILIEYFLHHALMIVSPLLMWNSYCFYFYELEVVVLTIAG